MIRHLRRYVFAGLLFWLPVLATVVVIRFVFGLMDNTFALLPPHYRPEALIGFHIPGLGVVLAIVVILVTGVVISNFVGQVFINSWEKLLRRIPLVRSVYGGTKQIVEAFANSNQSFKKVVMIEYPRQGIWTLGFLTGTAGGEVQHRTKDEMVNIFVPTTPNPTSGFFLFLPRQQVVVLDMTPEEAIKMVISGGVVVPDWTPPPSNSDDPEIARQHAIPPQQQ